MPDPRVVEFYRALYGATPRVLVTRALVGVNIVIYVLTAAAAGGASPGIGQLLEYGASYGPLTAGGEPWRLLTSAFLHGSPAHIAFNMWVLWSAGHFVERLFGNVGFTLLYLVSALAGSVAALWTSPGAVLVGASGAVFGVYGALVGALVLQSRGVELGIPPQVIKNLRGTALAFVGFNVFFSALVPGISLSAHVGGLAGGFACGLVLALPLRVGIHEARRKRNALLLVAGVLFGTASVVMLPTELAALEDASAQFTAMEGEVLQRYALLREELIESKVTPPAFDARMQREVLAPWRRGTERLRTALGNSGVGGKPARLLRYAELRLESFELRAEGVRDGSRRAISLADAKEKAANKLARDR